MLSDSLLEESSWKRSIVARSGYFELRTADTAEVPVRLFLNQHLLEEAEPALYRQIVHATRFPGTRLVVITPDVHYGYGVPVGTVIVTDRCEGAIAMGPVGFDIGCGMVSAMSKVPASRATPDRRLDFNREVVKRVSLGTGGKSLRHGRFSEKEFQELVRGGAQVYGEKYLVELDRSRVERDRFPVDDAWDIPWGGKGLPERGLDQLGSLGGGNHFVELQRSVETDCLFVQVHTGSRGFGHGLATNFFELAKAEHGERLSHLDLGYFTPDSPHFRSYLNAVSAAGNYAILNRLILYEQIAEAFRRVFRDDLELVYEISHNLVQAEEHPEFGKVWVHRKGATRAFPKDHPALVGGPFQDTGHPVLIPGSNRDKSYILLPEPRAVLSAFSVNHGAGRRLSRGEAIRRLDQRKVDEQYRRDGIVMNLDGRVPLDESSACYKSADEVVGVVLAAGLAKVEFTLWPLCSIKGDDRRAGRERRAKQEVSRARDRDRRAGRRLKGRD